MLLQRAAECRVVRVHEHTRQQHAQLLQSALAKLVERVKSGKYNITIHITVTYFIISPVDRSTSITIAKYNINFILRDIDKHSYIVSVCTCHGSILKYSTLNLLFSIIVNLLLTNKTYIHV